MIEQSPDEKQYVITGFQLNQLRSYADLEFVCQAIRSHTLSDELRKERVKVMDTFGILHGEDAIRFNKYLNSHEPLNQRAQEIVRQARDLVAEDKNRETTHILNDAFFSMDIFFGDIPMDEHIIKWAVSKQDSFVTAAMACYLESRKLRGTL